jgi:hypothetical protein
MSASNSPPPEIVQPDSSAVQSYLTMLQGVITRMATNSSSCKTLCVTLVSAIVVIVADKGKPNFAGIALLPIILLGLLDAYYLGLEQGFRNTYNEFVKKMQADEATTKDLFLVIPKHITKKRTPDGKLIAETHPFAPAKATAIAFTSFSIYPFYLTLAAIVFLGKFLVS